MDKYVYGYGWGLKDKNWKNRFGDTLQLRFTSNKNKPKVLPNGDLNATPRNSNGLGRWDPVVRFLSKEKAEKYVKKHPAFSKYIPYKARSQRVLRLVDGTLDVYETTPYYSEDKVENCYRFNSDTGEVEKDTFLESTIRTANTDNLSYKYIKDIYFPKLILVMARQIATYPFRKIDNIFKRDRDVVMSAVNSLRKIMDVEDLVYLDDEDNEENVIRRIINRLVSLATSGGVRKTIELSLTKKAIDDELGETFKIDHFYLESLKEDYKELEDFKDKVIDIYDVDKFIQEATDGKWKSHIWKDMAIIRDKNSDSGLILDYEAIGHKFDSLDDILRFDISKPDQEEIGPDGSKHIYMPMYPEATIKLSPRVIIDKADHKQMKAGEFFEKCYGYNRRCAANLDDALRELKSIGYFDSEGIVEGREDKSLGEQIAKIVFDTFTGDCGPFGGEEPHKGYSENIIGLWSQNPPVWYEFNDDGSVDVDNRDYNTNFKYEDDKMPEDIHYDSVIDLINGETDDGWFAYFKQELGGEENAQKIIDLIRDSKDPEVILEEYDRISADDEAWLDKEIESHNFKVVSKRDYNDFMPGRPVNVHYQIISNEGNKTKEDLYKEVAWIDDLLDRFENRSGSPCTYMMGLQDDGFISCGFDCRATSSKYKDQFIEHLIIEDLSTDDDIFGEPETEYILLICDGNGAASRGLEEDRFYVLQTKADSVNDALNKLKDDIDPICRYFKYDNWLQDAREEGLPESDFAEWFNGLDPTGGDPFLAAYLENGHKEELAYLDDVTADQFDQPELAGLFIDIDRKKEDTIQYKVKQAYDAFTSGNITAKELSKILSALRLEDNKSKMTEAINHTKEEVEELAYNIANAIGVVSDFGDVMEEIIHDLNNGRADEWLSSLRHNDKNRMVLRDLKDFIKKENGEMNPSENVHVYEINWPSNAIGKPGIEDEYYLYIEEADFLSDNGFMKTLVQKISDELYDITGYIPYNFYYTVTDDKDVILESNRYLDHLYKERIPTGLYGEDDQRIFDSLFGQLSDGKWENSPRMEKYWKYMDTELGENDEIFIVVPKDYRWYLGFDGPNDIRRFFATHLKSLCKDIENWDGEKYKWDRNNTTQYDGYFHDPTPTVQDVYRVYDKLLGRKDRIAKDFYLESLDMNSLKDKIIDILEKSKNDKSKITLFETEPGTFVQEFDDGDIDFSTFKTYNRTEEEIAEGKSIATFMLSGGLNGNGEWVNYLDDLADLFNEWEDKLNLHTELYKTENDICDDVWTAEVILYPIEEELDESVNDGKIKYHYHGPVYHFNQIVKRDFDDWTEAYTRKEALSDLTYKAKRRLKYAPGSNIRLDIDYLEWFDPEDEDWSDDKKCEKCGTRLLDDGTCPNCDRHYDFESLKEGFKIRLSDGTYFKSEVTGNDLYFSDLDKVEDFINKNYNNEDLIKGYEVWWVDYGKVETDKDTFLEKIVKKGNKWQVQSEKGKNLGTYDTKEEAEKRLQQVHYFKHMNEDKNETETFLYPELKITAQFRTSPMSYDPHAGGMGVWSPAEYAEEDINISDYEYEIDKKHVKEELFDILSYELEGVEKMSSEDLKTYVNDNYDNLLDKYQQKLLDYFEDRAKEEAETKFYNDELSGFEKELDEDIEKHDTLNQKLFDGEELKPEVKETIEKIADTFIKELEQDGIKFTLKDIVLLGSNVSYNYTKDSDLDIHLIADSKNLHCPDELYPLLYSAYRSMFNKNYDITIKGIPAEIYVEIDEPQAKSNGIYSLNNGWIKKPEQKEIPDLDKEAFDKLFNEWEDKYFDLIGRGN